MIRLDGSFNHLQRNGPGGGFPPRTDLSIRRLRTAGNSLGHLEQVESYTPGHQVRFGNLNYTADIRGDLIFDRFEPMSGAPHSHNEHDLALPSDGVREIAHAVTPALNP